LVVAVEVVVISKVDQLQVTVQEVEAIIFLMLQQVAL
jgi:hypothetical protein